MADDTATTTEESTPTTTEETQGLAIDDATPDTSVGGGEKMPISDGGVPKSLDVDQIKDYVLANLSTVAETSSTNISADGVYIRQGDAVKRLPETLLAQAVMNYAFALTGIVTPNGNELFAVDDSGTKKTITLAQLTEYITANYAAVFASLAPADTLAASDSIFVKQGNTVKRGTLGVLAAFVHTTLATFFGSCVNVLTVQDSDKIVVVSGGVTKTMTVAQLKAAMAAVRADVPEETTAGNVPVWADAEGGLDNGLAVQTSVRAQGTADNNSLATEAAIRAAIGAEDSALRQAIAAAVDGVGDVKGPLSTTADKVPQWDSTTKKLKDGLTVATTVGSTGYDTALPTEKAVRAAIASEASARTAAVASEASARTAAVASEASARTAAIASATANMAEKTGSLISGHLAAWNASGKLVDGKGVVTSLGIPGSDDNVPTEKAVRSAIAAVSTAVGQIPGGDVVAPQSTTENKVPQWDSTQKKLKDGLTVTTSIGSSAADTKLPTEKAVKDAIASEASARTAAIGTATANMAEKSGTLVSGHLAAWNASGKLVDGKGVVTSLGIPGSNDNVPTEKAVRDALPVAATTSAAGLMSAADKVKLNNLVDTSSVAEIGTALADSDTVIVKQGDSVNKKSLLSRFWTYIMGKLPTYKIDDLAAGDDNTDLNANTTRHGLCPKLSGNEAHFLRGDGTFATPTGGSPFTGTDGEDAGTQGLVPAPATTDAGKFLCADGSWATPSGGGGGGGGIDIPGATAIDAIASGDLVYVYDVSASGYRKATAAQICALKRYDTMFIPANAMTPPDIGGAIPSSFVFDNNTHGTLVFSDSDDEQTEFSVVFPDDWDKGAVKVKALWAYYGSLSKAGPAPSGEAGQYVKFLVGAVSCGDGDAIGDAPTTFVDIIDQSQDANELAKSPASAALTPEGTLANGNLVHFVMSRDADYAPEGESTLAAELMLLGVLIQYGRTASYESW